MKLPRLPRVPRLDLHLLLLLALAPFPVLLPRADGAQISPTPTAPAPARLAFQTGRNDYTIQVGGLQRTYIVHVPARYNPATAAPLVVMLHGTGQNSDDMYTGSGWVQKAAAEGIIAVFPTSLVYDLIDEGNRLRTAKWNMASLYELMANPAEVPADDELYLKAVLSEAVATWNIDRRRIFAHGFSNGSQFVSSRLMMTMPDIFSAFAFSGTAINTGGTTPVSSNVSCYAMVGTLDDRVLSAAGIPGPLPMGATALMAPNLFGLIIPQNILTPLALDTVYDEVPGEPASLTTLVWDNRTVPSNSNEFRFRVVDGLTHRIPDNAPDVFWNFFLSHTGAAKALSGPPVISTHPITQTVTAGEPLTLITTVGSATSPTFQWHFNGTPLPGATGSRYTIPSLTNAHAGSYTVTVTNSAGSVTSEAGVISVLSSARLSNISVRTRLTASLPVIVGFVREGAIEPTLLRAAGPTLAQFGVASPNADPRIELYRGTTRISENNDWSSNLANNFADVGAFAFPAGSKDAALERLLTGPCTLHTLSSTSGLVVVEGYDSGVNSTARLTNISARSQVGTGENILIAGFNLAGSGTLRLLVRAVGPTLSTFGVAAPLADPRLEIFSSGGTKLGEADNWEASLANTFSSVGAFALPAGSKDAATVITLNAGTGYTVQVSGVNGGTGEALVEVYALR